MNGTIALHAARPPAHAEHPVVLTGLRAELLAPLRQPPLIIERRDQDFVAGLLADLGNEQARSALPSTIPRVDNGLPRLFPPVQRVFNVVVLEALCAIPGQPRLDPARIDSAGLVLRRVRAATSGTMREAWIKAGTAFFGWDAIDEDVDPAHDKRVPVASVGHPVLNRLLASNRVLRSAGSLKAASTGAIVEEQVHPLFVAPPDVCATAGKTFLFGVVPVSSGDMAESPAGPVRFGVDEQEREALRQHLVHYLKAGPARSLPRAGQPMTRQWAESADATAVDDEARGVDGRLGTFVLLLQQLHNEFDAFGPTAQARALFAAIDRIEVEFDTYDALGRLSVRREPAGALLLRAKHILLDGRTDLAQQMPTRWGAVSDEVAQAIYTAVVASLDDQFARVQPGRGRFDAERPGDAQARYVVRCFIRLKPQAPNCPPRLVWSGNSAPFTIAPWYESAGQPVPLVALPDLFDRGVLARLKPGIAFALPPKLANLLRGDPNDLRDGKGSGDGPDLAWLCSFSIPIITLCAFIVLGVFLQLLNMIFFWLPFVKICIPFPKSK